MRHLDLFSGIGGFALAARWSEFQTIAFSEIDPYAIRVLRKHWPDVPNLGDIRKVNGIHADIVTGGFPCQPFSVAGKQKGTKDDRHLWPEMCRVIAESGATWVVGENVTGIIGMELDNVLSDLEGIGYTALPITVPACAVDAPHRRERVWILAHHEIRGRDVSKTKEPAEYKRQREGATGRCSCSQNVADANQPRSQGRDGAELPECSGERVTGSGGASLENTKLNPCRAEVLGGEINGPNTTRPTSGISGSSGWLPEPAVGRVAHGIPHRVDRLKGLGNAIVPQVAFAIFQGICAVESGT